MNPIENQELVATLTRTGQAIGRLAEDDTLFRAAVDAFRARDAESFGRLLNQLKIDRCEFICRWLCSKECVLECIELCGPPTADIAGIDQISEFARIIAKITADEELIERLAGAVQERDAQAFRRLASDLKIERFCHLLCHWACAVYCRLACEVVCEPPPVIKRNFINELSIAGAAIARVSNTDTFAGIIKAGLEFDCEFLNGIFGGFGDCEYICEWICSWRCVLLCLPFCLAFPVLADTSIEEERAFALVSAKIAAKPGAFARLVDAVANRNNEAFGAIVKELQLEPYCLQLCHWICYEICRLFCICVCQQPATIPLFTHVGSYRVPLFWGDFTAQGTTTAGNLAFTQTIPLIGILPDGAAPDPLEYRFRAELYPLGGGPFDITGPMIPATLIGQLEYWEWDSGLSQWVVHSANYYVNNPGATVTINQPIGSLTVSVNKDVGPGGWIAVPRENSFFFGGIGRFVPQGGLANLDTTKLTTEVFDLRPIPVNAGDAMPAPQKSVKPVYKIYFETRKVGTIALLNANNLDKIALSNTSYTYTRHLDWAGGDVTTILVLSLDIKELRDGGGCIPLSNDVHALFTVYHPYLGTCEVYLQGPGIPPPAPVNPPISVDGEADSPAGGTDFNIAALTPCAYNVWISATLNLTSGYGAIYGTFSDNIGFCKH